MDGPEASGRRGSSARCDAKDPQVYQSVRPEAQQVQVLGRRARIAYSVSEEVQNPLDPKNNISPSRGTGAATAGNVIKREVAGHHKRVERAVAAWSENHLGPADAIPLNE